MKYVPLRYWFRFGFYLSPRLSCFFYLARHLIYMLVLVFYIFPSFDWRCVNFIWFPHFDVFSLMVLICLFDAFNWGVVSMIIIWFYFVVNNWLHDSLGLECCLHFSFISISRLNFVVFQLCRIWFCVIHYNCYSAFIGILLRFLFIGV